MNSFEKAFKEVKTLVKNFKDNEKYYLSPSYSEIDARRDFIDKFFEALGWDVYHNTQKNPYEQEVRVEKNVAVGKAQKRADYSFCISPNYRDTKFYVEAKKPSKNLYNPDYYFQAIRYGWNANTPIVILTDFEEFHIIDSRFKPDIKTALDRQIERYHYSEYKDKEKLSRIYYLLSHEAVEDNSIEKRAAELPKPRGKDVKKGLFKGGEQSIDESFLKELDEIRITLAKIFKKNNQKLTSEELTEATQRTIDRLVFIRFLEDKLIEGEHYVSEFGGKNSVWKDFIATSKRFDVKYNGIVFKNHPIIDSPDFKEADDIYFKKICEDLSYENTPYDFNAIPIHILGSIYERFLGKIIHATNKQVRIEEKPEVRKAGGVFYTVLYIVRYIVDNTVGKIIEGKTPKEISKLRFIDISCGSGTFLIVIFDTLLHYIGKWYQEHPEQAKKDGCIFKDGQWVLSLKQKQEILLNNIYGVDIDYQAVEVTQLSLFLKLLEDETTATANEMQVLFKEKILPDLSKNIVCGNSLIGTDILSGNMFASEEERKLNPMDFETMFPEIMKNGGFDAIVGNPPYLRIQGLQEHHPLAVEYLKNKYHSASTGSIDIYIIFLEKILKILNINGLTGYILPHKFFQSDFGKNIRYIISTKKAIFKILNFGANQVFENATTYTCLFFMSGKTNNKFKYYKFDNCDNLAGEINNIEFFNIPIEETNSEQWNFYSDSKRLLIKKLESHPTKLKDYTRKIFQGIATGLDGVFVLQVGADTIENDKTIILYSKALESYIEIEKSILKPFLMGKDVKRYQPSNILNYIIFPYSVVDEKTVAIDKKILIEKFPKAWQYLLKNRSILEARENYRFKNKWWQFSRPQNLNEFNSLKIMTPEIANSCQMTYDVFGNIYHTTKVYSFTFNKSVSEDEYYFLGILNSKLLWFYLESTGYILRGGYFTFKTNYLSPFPIPKINFKNETEKQSHDKIVSLVDKMLEAKKQLKTAKTDNDKTYYERRCETLDRQIDQLVYKLYGLTEEEIRIVEGEGDNKKSIKK